MTHEDKKKTHGKLARKRNKKMSNARNRQEATSDN